VTAHQLTLLAVIGTTVCWGAFALAWLLGAIFYESQAPAERTRSRFGTAVWPGLVITVAIDFAVPRAELATLPTRCDRHASARSARRT
jgi:hypothetical protein